MNNTDYVKLSDIKKEALEAEKRIREHIRETHVEYSPYLSQSGDCNVYLKLENLQLSGSFKLRGVMNKLLSLAKKERKTELATASSGNHGAAFAYALKKLGLRGTIYMPSIANQAKIEGLRYYDAELKFHGTDCVETEVFARNAAEKNHLQYIPPYNDLKIIGGQATISAVSPKTLQLCMNPLKLGELWKWNQSPRFLMHLQAGSRKAPLLLTSVKNMLMISFLSQRKR